MLEIFTFTTTDFSMTEAEEVATIEAAKAGDDAAKMDLIRAYGPVLRSTVARFGKRNGAGDDLDLDDLQSAALAAFLEVIESHDPEKSPRLAGRVSSYLSQNLAEEFATAAAFTVPSRTLKRFYGILKAANGDAELGATLAAEYGMGLNTYRDVLAAIRGTDSLDGVSTDEDGSLYASIEARPVYSPSPVVDVEDKMLVDLAFKSVSDEEARIVELAYGFTEYEPVPDAEIGHRLGLTRPTVQRRRSSALGSMRKALGVTHA